MKTYLITILCIIAMVILVTASMADIPMPTNLTVLFQKDGKPYRKPVDFKVRCYGWSGLPGKTRPVPYTPKEIYSFSGSCPDFGCRIRHNLHLNYTHIDYCNLEGLSEGKRFKVEKFGNNPMGTCSEAKPGSGFKRNCELSITLPQ
jgi:hypothetical protein